MKLDVKIDDKQNMHIVQKNGKVMENISAQMQGASSVRVHGTSLVYLNSLIENAIQRHFKTLQLTPASYEQIWDRIDFELDPIHNDEGRSLSKVIEKTVHFMWAYNRVFETINIFQITSYGSRPAASGNHSY